MHGRLRAPSPTGRATPRPGEDENETTFFRVLSVVATPTQTQERVPIHGWPLLRRRKSRVMFGYKTCWNRNDRTGRQSPAQPEAVGSRARGGRTCASVPFGLCNYSIHSIMFVMIIDLVHEHAA